MKSEDLLRQALEIEAPWQITRVRNDLGRRQIDIWVGRESARSGWFFSARGGAPEARERAWRHINVGHSRCIVHAAPPGDADSGQLAWFGSDDQPFTHGLSRQIAAMFREGINFQSVCSMLDIPVADLWKFKHGLDSGKAGLSPLAPPPAERPASGVPDASDPLWEGLLDGTINIDIRVLSLKLLLTKLREQMAVITDPEVRILKAHEMQRYFTRHEHMLGHELAQLTRF